MTRRFVFAWQLNAKILVFVLVFFPLTLGLGFWQLERADEKTRMIEAQRERESLPPLTNANWQDINPLHLRQFDLQVTFDSRRWFLLDNRVYQGRPGYEVLNLGRMVESGTLVLVNRGWVPASLDRAELPEVEIPAGEVRIRGYFYAPTQDSFQLGEQSWTGSWPERIQYVDIEALRAYLPEGDALLAARLRLDESDPLVLTANWQLVNQSPARHMGYAVQWFALALALVILGLFANSNLGEKFANREKQV